MVEILTIVAIVLGPIFAIQIQKYLERKREDKGRRLRVFKTLMVTRGSVLSPAHVEALNAIDIEFNSSDNEDKNVRDAWKAYLDQLGHFPKDNATEDEPRRWKEKTDELLVELLYVMAKAVGYDFDKTHIKRTAYTPAGYFDMENEQHYIRKSIVELFKGKASIPVIIKAASSSDGKVSSEEKLRQLLIEHYEGNKPIRVVIENDPKKE